MWRSLTGPARLRLRSDQGADNREILTLAWEPLDYQDTEHLIPISDPSRPSAVLFHDLRESGVNSPNRSRTNTNKQLQIETDVT